MTHRIPWHKRILKEKKKELVSSAILAVVFALATLLWHYFTGKGFAWESISPIEEPGLLPRIFYSALVYATLGAAIYATGFYKFLYSLYRGTRGGWKAYKKTKERIWVVLILIMFFVIIPTVVYILNAVISFFYNVLNLILFIFPPLGITAILFGGYKLLKKYLAEASS
jgi:hypothetical protein